MIYLIIAAILVLSILAGYYNALMDLSSEGHEGITYRGKEVEAKDESWKNKWKIVDGQFTQDNLNPWYYFLHRKLGVVKLYTDEKFPLSSTALVWLTDDWHFFKFIFYRCIDAISVILLVTVIGYWALIGILVIPIVRAMSFERKYKQKHKRL